MRKISPSILKLKIPKDSIHHKRNKSKNIQINGILNNITEYYKDPWFYNDNNLDYQLNSMNIMFKRNKIEENESQRDPFLKTEVTNNNNITNLKYESIKKEEDLLLYQNIFKVKGMWKRRKKPINNLLNLRFAENEKQYNEIAKKENESLRLKGKPMKKLVNSRYLENQLKEIRSKAKFMKCVEDFVLPSIVIAKIKSVDNELKQKNKERQIDYLNPMKQRDNECLEKQNKRKLFLSETISINNNLK